MVFKLILFFSVKRWFIRFYSFHLCRVACHTSLTESCQKVVFLYVVLIPMIVLYILWLLSFKRWFFVSLAFHPLLPLCIYPQFYLQLICISFCFTCQKVVLPLLFSSFYSLFPVIRWFYRCQKVVLNCSKSGSFLVIRWSFSCHKVVIIHF